MLGNNLQQTTSAGDIFRYIFLGALRVKPVSRTRVRFIGLEDDTFGVLEYPNGYKIIIFIICNILIKHIIV